MSFGATPFGATPFGSGEAEVASTASIVGIQGAIQKSITADTSLSAALMLRNSILQLLEGALQKSRSEIEILDAAVLADLLAAAPIDSAVAVRLQVIGDIEGAVQSGRDSTVELDAVTLAEVLDIAGLDAAVLTEALATVGLTAILAPDGTTAGTAADAAIQAARLVTAVIDGAVQARLSIGAGLNARLIVVGGLTGQSEIDAAVRKERTAVISIGAAVLTRLIASWSIDAAVAMRGEIVEALDSAVRRLDVAQDTSVDAALYRLMSVVTSFEASIMLSGTAATLLGAAVRGQRSVSAGVNAALSRMSVATTQILSVVTLVDRQTSVGIDALLSIALRMLSLGGDAVLQARLSAMANLTAFVVFPPSGGGGGPTTILAAGLWQDDRSSGTWRSGDSTEGMWG